MHNSSRVMISPLSDEVRSWQSPELTRDWDRIWHACPWATYAQSPPFCRIWYETFTDWTPLIIVGKDGPDTIGIAPLAWQQETRSLIFAGAELAEYKSWIALPEHAGEFLAQTLRWLVARIPFRKLECLFLPSDIPLSWLGTDAFSRGRTCLRPLPKPIVRLEDPSTISASLRKSRNKSNLNHLRRLGSLSQRRVHSPADADRLVTALQVFAGIRMGALHGVRLAEDPKQREFLNRLIRETDIPHLSGLFIDDRLVAGHIGYRTRDQVLLGSIAHDPRLEAHSPGKLELLLLAQQLAAEGIRTFDLTPGGEYKERLATDYETAYIANFFRRRTSRDLFVLTRRLAAVLRWIAARAGRTPDQIRLRLLDLREKLALLRPAHVFVTVLRTLRQWIAADREYRVYSILPFQVNCGGVEHVAEAGRLQDLLAFHAEEPWLTRRRFLVNCMRSLAEGSVPYTHVENGRLTHFGWLDYPKATCTVGEMSQRCVMPSQCVALSNSYTVPSARRRGLHFRSLRQRLAEASQLPGVQEIVVGVLADNWSSRNAIEKLGFQWRFSLFERRRLWMVRRWRSGGQFVTAVVPDEVSAEPGKPQRETVAR